MMTVELLFAVDAYLSRELGKVNPIECTNSLKAKATDVAGRPWAVPVAWFILVYHSSCTTGFISLT